MFILGELTVAGTLDYSSTLSYELIIKAIDSLTGSWSEVECIVTIMDVNNNYPMFEKSFYKVSVPENIKIGINIITSIFIF